MDNKAEWILSKFPEEKDIYKDTNRESRPNKTVIFTNDRLKCIDVFDNLYKEKELFLKIYTRLDDNIALVLQDGSEYTWTKPIENSRGIKCDKAYIDKDISCMTLLTIVFPACLYCSKEDITII